MSIATNTMDRAVKTNHRSTMPATMGATPLQDYACYGPFWIKRFCESSVTSREGHVLDYPHSRPVR